MISEMISTLASCKNCGSIEHIEVSSGPTYQSNNGCIISCDNCYDGVPDGYTVLAVGDTYKDAAEAWNELNEDA